MNIFLGLAVIAFGTGLHCLSLAKSANATMLESIRSRNEKDVDDFLKIVESLSIKSMIFIGSGVFMALAF